MSNQRRLSEKSVKVLGLIAEGHSYSQIVDGHADIHYHDIFHAAEEALRLDESKRDYHERIAQIKSRYPNAYEPWSAADDIELAAMHSRCRQIEEMATRFQRQPSAIRSRLAKLNLNCGDEYP
jgi:hypothetical protein